MTNNKISKKFLFSILDLTFLKMS